MSSALAVTQSETELIGVLQSSLYPGATIGSVKMVLGYCKAAGLDPMQKPVHIVPMWDKNTKAMRDVVMPGIGLYRTQAARSGQYAGVTDPEFGPDTTEDIGGTKITFPAWCRVTVKRLLGSTVVEFAAREFWKENYATASKDSAAPNAMWKRRPYAQLAKCAEAQALRKAFPELGSAPTADEMEGKEYADSEINPTRQTGTQAAEAARSQPAVDSEERTALIAKLEEVAEGYGIDAYAETWSKLKPAERKMVGAVEHERLKKVAASIKGETVDTETGEVAEPAHG
jgi:phage recombination protein Bet